MDGYRPTLTLTLGAADDDGVCTAQAPLGAGNLVINGALAVSGAVTFDNPRQVVINSAGDDSGISFTVNGLARNGKALSEQIPGANTGDATSTHQFASISSIAASGASAGNVKVGTNAVGSTAPHIVNTFGSNGDTSYSIQNANGAAMSPALEVSFDDLAPYWETEQTLPNWIKYDDAPMGIIKGPIRMVRLTNFAGHGTAIARLITPMKSGRV